jgi:hypothetical protein
MEMVFLSRLMDMWMLALMLLYLLVEVHCLLLKHIDHITHVLVCSLMLNTSNYTATIVSKLKLKHHIISLIALCTNISLLILLSLHHKILESLYMPLIIVIWHYHFCSRNILILNFLNWIIIETLFIIIVVRIVY